MIELGLSSQHTRESRHFDLGQRYRVIVGWADVAAGLHDLTQCLAQEPIHCCRGLIHLSRLSGYEPYALRLTRSLALGQHLRRLPGDSLDGQFGLYGTAAGLELLVTTECAKKFRSGPFDHPTREEIEWVKITLSLGNFLDLALRDFASRHGTKFWEQARTTLRASNLLRALATASSALGVFSQPQRYRNCKCDPETLLDIANSFTQAGLEGLCTTLFQSLAAAKVDSNPVSFKFAVDAAGLPETWGENMFVWSSVLVSLVRAYSRNVISEEQVDSLITHRDVTSIIGELQSQKHEDDNRYKVFLLWSLSHLTADAAVVAGSSPEIRELPGRYEIPAGLQLSERQAKWLRREVESVCTDLLESDYSLTDLHSPYQILFDDPTRAERYRDEYFVIPIFPIVLDLVSRYKPNWLFRPRLSSLLYELSRVTRHRPEESNLILLPFQVGAHNGTVNALYYTEAATRAASVINTRPIRKILLAVGWPLWDEMRGSPKTTITVAVIAAVIAFFWPAKPWLLVPVLVIFTFPLWYRSFWAFGFGLILGILEHLVAEILRHHP